jgi:uncharacterized protein (TIGR02145 family)
MKHLGYIIACFVILLNVQLVNAQGDVNIGTQVWTSKNLDVSTFRNGEPIPEAKSEKEWAKAGENKQPAWCYFDNDVQNGKKYGKLYNWYAVNDKRGLAPKGYHIPTGREWRELLNFLGGEGKAGKKMKSKTGWNNSGNGSNSSGFNGLPGGYRSYSGYFGDIGGSGSWWSSTEAGNVMAYGCSMRSNDFLCEVSSLNAKQAGFSVCCIRDYKQEYSVIGNQIWMSQNLDVCTFRNGDPIFHAKTSFEWMQAGKEKEPAFCYYDFDMKNGRIYGKLYNFYAVQDSRGLAPYGYHIPTDTEWTVLTQYLGGVALAGHTMKSKTGWYESGNGDNSSLFNGLPGAYCNHNGNFFNITKNGYFWSSSEDNTGNAWFRLLEYINTKVFRFNNYKEYGLSVRCLRD